MLFRWIALIAAVVLIVAVAGIILSSQQSAKLAPQQSAEKNYEEGSAEKNEVGLFDRWFPDSTAVFNLFLMIFTGVLAFGGLIQLNLLTRAERIAAQTAKAAQDSANATKDSVNLASKTAERRLRAYVFISKAEISDIMSDQKLTAKIAVKNFGQTPAYDVETSIGIQTTQFPLIMKLPDAIQKTKTGAIGPGWEIVLNFNGDGPSEIEWRPRFAQKNGAFYLYGTIKYVDAFKIPRFTNFRLYKGGDTGVSGPELSVSPDGNESKLRKRRPVGATLAAGVYVQYRNIALVRNG